VLFVLKTRHVFALSAAFATASFGACNCDPDLYSTPGKLLGIVCDVGSGAALQNTSVTVVDADGVSIDTTTDETGTFTADKLSTGNATITVHDAAGDAGADRTFTVDIEAARQAKFSDEACHAPVPPPTPTGTVEGRICDEAAGAWVPGANVFVITTAGGVFSTGTNPDGTFSLTDVPVGPQHLEVQKGSFYEAFDVTVVEAQVVNVPSPDTCETAPPPPGSGTVDGRVCAPDGETWLADATVYVERPDGSRSQATTDADGHYTLTGVPAGAQVVNIEKGSFHSTVDVTVTADQTTTVPDDQCAILSPTVKVAVVTGQYDHVEQVLSDLGIQNANVDTYDGTSFGSPWITGLLDDFATLSTYDIVFLNCGLNDSRIVSFPDQTAINNLKQFVQNGGSVYASDWAYTVVETAWPDKIDFARTDTDFSPLAANSPKFGTPVNGLAATIVDANLATGMGTSSISLDYQLGEWVAMQAVASGVTVYITGDAPLEDGSNLTDVPHTVGFNVGAGRVLYTSFHQEPGVNQNQERVLQLLMFEL
jgi:hypothetical protein